MMSVATFQAGGGRYSGFSTRTTKLPTPAISLNPGLDTQYGISVRRFISSSRDMSPSSSWLPKIAAYGILRSIKSSASLKNA